MLETVGGMVKECLNSVCLYIPPIRRLSGWRIITLAKECQKLECSLIFTGLDFIDDPTIDFHMGASAPVNKGSGTQPGSRYDATNMDRHSAVGGRMGNTRNIKD
ncbi:hypothetical protein ScPMuIL_016475 [Solemya velum]